MAFCLRIMQHPQNIDYKRSCKNQNINDVLITLNKLSLNISYLLLKMNWISKLPQDTKISELLLPGSHHSATANIQLPHVYKLPILSNFWKSVSECQDDSVSSQLYNGVRYFHFEIKYYNDEFYIVYNFVLEKFKTALLEFDRFLKNNSGEIVLLHIKIIDNHPLKDGTKRKCDDGLQVLKFHLHPGGREWQDTTVGHLVNKNYNVIVFSDDAKYAFPYSTIDIKWSKTWDVSFAKRCIYYRLERFKNDPPKSKNTLYAIATWLTPNVSDLFKKYITPFSDDSKISIDDSAKIIGGFLVHKIAGGETFQNLNIVILDYATKYSLPQKLIEINSRRVSQRTKIK